MLILTAKNATTARAQQENLELQAQDVVVACRGGGQSGVWFGRQASFRILNLEQAVDTRKTDKKANTNRFETEVDTFEHYLSDIEGDRHRKPGNLPPSSDELCAKKYVALLKSFDKPSADLAYQEMKQESLARIANDRLERQEQKRKDDAIDKQTEETKESIRKIIEQEEELREFIARQEAARKEEEEDAKRGFFGRIWHVITFPFRSVCWAISSIFNAIRWTIESIASFVWWIVCLPFNIILWIIKSFINFLLSIF